MPTSKYPPKPIAKPSPKTSPRAKKVVKKPLSQIAQEEANKIIKEELISGFEQENNTPEPETSFMSSLQQLKNTQITSSGMSINKIKAAKIQSRTSLMVRQSIENSLEQLSMENKVLSIKADMFESQKKNQSNSPLKKSQTISSENKDADHDLEQEEEKKDNEKENPPIKEEKKNATENTDKEIVRSKALLESEASPPKAEKPQLSPEPNSSSPSPTKTQDLKPSASGIAGVNFQTVSRLKKISKQFHHKVQADVKFKKAIQERAIAELPQSIYLSLINDTMPILTKMKAIYVQELGDKSELTKSCEERLEQLNEILQSSKFVNVKKVERNIRGTPHPGRRAAVQIKPSELARLPKFLNPAEISKISLPHVSQTTMMTVPDTPKSEYVTIEFPEIKETETKQ